MEILKGDYLLAKKSRFETYTLTGEKNSLIYKGNMYIVSDIFKGYHTFYAIEGAIFSNSDVYTYFYTKIEERELKLKKLTQ